MVHMQHIVRKSHLYLCILLSSRLIVLWTAFMKMQMRAGSTKSSHANVSGLDIVSTDSCVYKFRRDDGPLSFWGCSDCSPELYAFVMFRRKARHETYETTWAEKQYKLNLVLFWCLLLVSDDTKKPQQASNKTILEWPRRAFWDEENNLQAFTCYCIFFQGSEKNNTSRGVTTFPGACTVGRGL